LRFAKLNPLGANLAIGPLITVLALTYGASDFQTGLLYASMHLCGVILLIMPALARPDDNKANWHARVATRLDCSSIPDDLTAASLLYLAWLSSQSGGLQ
jgi:hypothetical protein